MTPALGYYEIPRMLSAQAQQHQKWHSLHTVRRSSGAPGYTQTTAVTQFSIIIAIYLTVPFKRPTTATALINSNIPLRCQEISAALRCGLLLRRPADR